jgi:5-hydroxyisourate hydrolase-like protein (transthyretin family)
MGIYVPGTLGDNVMCVSTGQPLANITVNLYKDFNGDGLKDGAAIATTQTNASGFYQFSGLEVALAGGTNITKYIVEVDTADPDLGDCNVPIPPTSYNPPLDSNKPNDPDNDFKFEKTPRFTLGDRVWYDQNQNGIQDANEPGYPGGVSVALYQGNTCTGAAMATTTTNGNGIYGFTNLLAGTYSVGFSTLPSGWSISPKDQGSNDAVDSDANAAGCIENINLTANDPTRDMGIYVPGTLGDNVMCVSTGQPLANITVNLYKDFNGDGLKDGAAIATTQTNASGFYQFSGLEVALAGGTNITKYIVEVDTADPDLGDCNVPIPPTSYNPPLDSNKPNDPNNDFKFEKSAQPAVDLEKYVLVIPTVGTGDMCPIYSKPQVLTMKYIGGAANVSAQASGKVVVSGDPGTTSPVRIRATNKSNPADTSARVYFDGQVLLGETFDINARSGGQTTLETNTYFYVYNLSGTLLQSVIFHTSCSQPIQLGDIYGSAQLVGYKNSSGGGATLPEPPTGLGDDADTPTGPSATMGDTIRWTYVVTNTGSTPLQNGVVTDDKLGTVCNIPFLAVGESKSCVATGLANQFGQYVNEGKVEAFSPQGVKVSDTDPAHYIVPEPCAVCKGGTVELTFEYLGSVPARVIVYDDTSAKADKILFDSMLNPDDQFTITPRPGQAKLNNDITIFVNAVLNAKVHTSCSQPIGPGLISGDFEIENARSKDNGLMCPLNVCAPNAAATLEIKDREVKWNIANNGDLPLEISSISITWPQANGALDEIKRDGDTIHKGDFNPPSAVINSGWDGGASKRTIKPAETDTIKFKFKNNASTSGEYTIRVEFVQGCFVEVYYKGGTSTSAFTCSKPINELTMVWNGSAQTVWVTAWKGTIGSTALATLQPVSRGAALTVSGYAGSPNDVYWEIFSDPAGTNKLGVSTFHVSCSDADMNGADDCGKPQGDGKGKTGFLNDWLLKGMVDSDETLVCTLP